jgi:hypothetical protein
VALSLRPCARGNEPIVLAAYLLAQCASWSRWWLLHEGIENGRARRWTS